MGKDPAFLFYPNDYIGGTMGMTFEEKGAYIELLMTQFNRGHMTSQVIGQVVGHLWVNLQSKFKQDENGLYYNERLDIEIEKRKTFIQSRFNNLTGKNQYSKKEGHKGGHKTDRMEDENENILHNTIIIGVGEEKKITWRESFEIYTQECNKAYNIYLSDLVEMQKQQKLNPGINIKLSIEKGYHNFWSTEAGWKYKKKSRYKTIDWKATITKSIDINKVYYTREEQSKNISSPYVGKTVTNPNPT